MDAAKGRLRKLLILPPLIAGVGAIAIAVGLRGGPERIPVAESVFKVRIIDTPEVTLVPRALGYGNVQPGTVWQAVAEVGGKVITVHPQLKKGAIVAKDEVLLRIDPTRYEMAVAQIEANIEAKDGQLAELAVKEANNRATLDIDERSLALSRKDLRRKRSLLAKKHVSQAAVDEEERNVLAREQTVQASRNSLNLVPTERRTLKAEMALYEAQLATARLDLDRTTIIAPFDCRIADVGVQESQYAAQGTVLAVADSIGVSEVAAQVPIGRLINLMPKGTAVPAGAGGIMKALPDLLGLEAIVRLRGGTVDARWQARFTRISDTIDPQTRTVGVVVAVDKPYGQAILGVRPPLAKNMFVEVELRGRPVAGQVVIPRGALRDGNVYVVGEDKRLRMRPVEVRFLQTRFAAIQAGLKAGEPIIVSDLVPAIEGMLLDPVADDEVRSNLISDAEGKGPAR
jgi:membrane fusion protein, multidrug efflux system